MTPPTSPGQTPSPPVALPYDPFDIAGSMLAIQEAWLRHPERLTASLQDLVLGSAQIRDHFFQTALNIPSEPALDAHARDDRFQSPAWTELPAFCFLKDMYLLNCRWLQDAIYATEGVAPQQRERAAFWLHPPDRTEL